MIQGNTDDLFTLVRNSSRIFHSGIERQEGFLTLAIVELQVVIVNEQTAGNAHVELNPQISKGAKQMSRRRGGQGAGPERYALIIGMYLLQQTFEIFFAFHEHRVRSVAIIVKNRPVAV